MRLALRLCIKARGAAQQVTIYGNYNPTPINLMAIKTFGLNAVQEHSFKFLRHELPIRLANILQEIKLLPPSLLETHSVKTVVGWYEQSFKDLLNFEDADGKSYSVLSDFTDTLDEIRERHTNVVETMAKGILTIKKRSSQASQLIDEDQLQYFLDRFYTSRIGIRMLIHNHILLFGPHLNEHRLIGCIDPNCNVRDVVVDAYQSASKLCLQHFKRTAPELNVRIIDSISPRENDWLEIVYVPTHLYHMVFEMMKNAMRATMEFQESNGLDKKPSPLNVLVVGGKEDVTIKISDRGGGIPRSMMSEIFKYTFTTARRQDDDSESDGESTTSPVKLAGYGYGLPLSRLYARYLSGDLELFSSEGYGTDAHIILKRQAADAEESLPVFNKTCVNHYAQNGNGKKDESDWLGLNNTPRTASG